MPAPTSPQFTGASMQRSLKKDGGFSVNSAGKSPTDGYMVSLPGTEKQIRSQNVTPGHIDSFLERHGAELGKGGDRYAGGWNNKKTDLDAGLRTRDASETSLDVSQNIRPKADVAAKHGSAVAQADALTSTQDLMVARNQEAAYDVKSGDDVVNPHFKGRGPGR